MSYTRPTYSSANATWQGAPAYTRPAYNAAHATWLVAVVGRVAVPSPLGAPAVTARQVVSARVSVPTPLGAPAVLGDTVAEVYGRVAVPSPLGAPAATGQVVVAGRAAVPSPLGVPALVARMVYAARVAVPSPLGAPAVRGRVMRYEVRGAVRQSGVALSRRVRAYRLSDGAFLGETDTALGKYRCPAGLVDGELCYLIPIDMSGGAVDYRPVASNRVAAVLADDVAEIAA